MRYKQEEEILQTDLFFLVTHLTVCTPSPFCWYLILIYYSRNNASLKFNFLGWRSRDSSGILTGSPAPIPIRIQIMTLHKAQKGSHVNHNSVTYMLGGFVHIEFNFSSALCSLRKLWYMDNVLWLAPQDQINENRTIVIHLNTESFWWYQCSINYYCIHSSPPNLLKSRFC